MSDLVKVSYEKLLQSPSLKEKEKPVGVNIRKVAEIQRYAFSFAEKAQANQVPRNKI